MSMGHSLARVAALLGATLLAGLSGSARADSDLVARFDYSMPARFAVPTPAPEGDSEVYIAPGQSTHPATWRVDFDACASTGTIAQYRWYIGGSFAGNSSSCAGFSHDFPAEGEYAVSLTVVDGGGGEHTYDAQVVVQDWLIFGLGDSYGSGEGNPDVPISFDAATEAAATAWEAAAAAEDAAYQAYLDVLAGLGATEADVEAVQGALEEFISALAEWEAECLPVPGLGCPSATTALNLARSTLMAEFALLELDFDNDDLVAIATSFAALDDARDTVAVALGILEEALAALTPTWQNRRCHRSAISGQVQAAELLEASDPHTSVTFVHLACSGGTIFEGLLGSYAGIETDGPLIDPQIDRAAQIAGGREIDMLVISIGGNDVNFGPVLETCMVGEPCYQENPELDPALDELLSGLCDFEVVGPLVSYCQDYIDGIEVDSATQIFEVHAPAKPENHQDGLDDLPDGYQALATAIAGQLEVAPGRVYLTEYPDLTRDENGAYCGWSAEQDLSEQIRNLPGMSQSEFAWADTHAATLLRDAMRSAAATHGWSFVEGVAAPFGTHGYCAEENWLVRLQESFLEQGDQFGALHPGPVGHQVYADVIAAAVPEPGLDLGMRAALLTLALCGFHRRRPGPRDRSR